MTPAGEVLAERIRRHGPLPFRELVDVALYHGRHGFYVGGGRAGRRGDFLTSPEVGPLFGAVLARALDDWWRALGYPDPYVVIEAGAGVGTLCRSVLAAGPACAPALRYVLVEQSPVLRVAHADGLPLVAAAHAFPSGPEDTEDEARPGPVGIGPLVVSLADLPNLRVTGVVVANELLDNLPFDVLERVAEGWAEVRVGLLDDELVEVLVPGAEAPVEDGIAVGARVPVQERAAAWVRDAIGRIERGRLVAFDYASTTPELGGRPVDSWLRTYRGHERGGSPLVDVGLQDITVEVAVDQLQPGPDADWTQADFLRSHGLDELVEEGRRIWAERAHLGDLAAVKARSRIGEAEALTDEEGLGAFRVLEWEVTGS